MRHFALATVILVVMGYITITGKNESATMQMEIAKRKDKERLDRPKPWDSECIACVDHKGDHYTVDSHGCIR